MKTASKYDGIILDIDGTIWNTTGIVSIAWNKAIDNSKMDAKKIVAQDLQKEFGKTMDVIALDLWPNLSKNDRSILMDYCCTEEQIMLSKNTMDITYPNVIETIKELSIYIDFYIVSNCQSGYIELTLEKTGLAKYIKDFECYGNTLKGKAENLQLLIQRNNLLKPVYIGDTQGDCDSCFQARIPFIWASYGFGVANKYISKLDNFAQLKDLMYID